MYLLAFLTRTTRAEQWRAATLTVAAALANVLLVVIVITAAGLLVNGQPLTWAWWLALLGVFAAYLVSQVFARRTANIVVTRMMKQCRLDLADLVRRSELRAVDQAGRGAILSMLTQQTNQLSDALPVVADCIQRTIVLVVALAYVAYLSPAAGLVFSAAVIAGALLYGRLRADVRGNFQRAALSQARLRDAIGDLVRGAKELRLNRRRSDAAMADLGALSRAAGAPAAAVRDHGTMVILLGTAIALSILGVVVFVLPWLDALGDGTTLLALLPIVLFCLGNLAALVEQSATCVQADLALQSIGMVERQLAAGTLISPADARTLARAFDGFTTIAFTAITFSVRDAAGAPVFTTGPWDLTLRRGETVFLVGRNGSGKSTALRLLAGLDRPDHGRVSVDGAVSADPAHAGLREQCAAILDDFHLFDRLYGLEQVDPATVQPWIDAMWLTAKVKFSDGRFTSLDLSPGERKRLALIVALLGNRPILIFDEWSSDQETTFREEFYGRILPELKARGKTVVAVTHDERFWHLADRVIGFERGAIAWERPGRGADGVVRNAGVGLE